MTPSVISAVLYPSNGESGADRRRRQGANWLVFLLPYVEQNALYEQWDFDIPANLNPGRSEELAIYKCPSDPQSDGNFCSYAGGQWARGTTA